MYELDDELRSAVETVAARHDLKTDRLNDGARPGGPATFDLDGCQAALAHGERTVLRRPVDVVLIDDRRRMTNAQRRARPSGSLAIEHLHLFERGSNHPDRRSVAFLRE